MAIFDRAKTGQEIIRVRLIISLFAIQTLVLVAPEVAGFRAIFEKRQVYYGQSGKDSLLPRPGCGSEGHSLASEMRDQEILDLARC